MLKARFLPSVTNSASYKEKMTGEKVTEYIVHSLPRVRCVSPHQVEKRLMQELLERHGGFSFRFETFAEIGKSLENVFSSTAGAVIKRVMGRTCGERFWIKMTKTGVSRREALKHLSLQKNMENWGEITYQNLDFTKRSGKIIVKASFEARGLSKSRENPSCHFLSGFFTGFLSGLFDENIAVVEEKCLAKGDPQCEFSFATSATAYIREAIRTRDQMVQEMTIKHRRGEETAL